MLKLKANSFRKNIIPVKFKIIVLSISLDEDLKVCLLNDIHLNETNYFPFLFKYFRKFFLPMELQGATSWAFLSSPDTGLGLSCAV